MKIEKSIIETIKNGGVGVLPTDTLYGLVGSALNKKAVQKSYRLKQRSENKPFIILISKLNDLKLFGCVLGQQEKIIFKKYWPGKVTIVLPCPNLAKEMSYLKPLNQTLALRMPKEIWLKSLLNKTGPLVAPSANPEGLPPACDINQAKSYFNKVDFYCDVGTLKSKPSKIIKIENSKIIFLRK
jgi:L-threonylcarbamoyladenylate synthase